MKQKRILSIVALLLVLSILASCAPKQVSVTFKFGEGIEDKVVTVTKGSTVTAPDVKENGKEVEGWYKDQDLKEKWDFANDTVSEDTTLFAKWKENASKVKVTLVYGKGNENVTVELDAGSKLPAQEVPTVDGFVFGGWYKDEACTEKWNDDAIDADVTLYAGWKEDIASGYNVITVAEALEIISGLESGVKTEERYYLCGTVKITNESYGQLDLTDETGTIMVYGTYSADGELRYDKLTEKPQTGDKVLIYGDLQNYKGTTPEVYSGWIIKFESAEETDPEPAVELPADGSELTIAQAIEIANSLGDDGLTEQRYFFNATVVKISNPAYGEMYLKDETGEIYVYGSYSADGATGYADLEDKPYAGDKVRVSALIHFFKGKPELKSVWIQSFEHDDTPIDESKYTSMSVKSARDAKEGDLVKLNGVVAQITYANGMKPSGFILVDGTSSIYVYDSQIAPRVAIGNTVTILGSKTWWVLESEQANAAKFGYKGCCQIENATLVDNDGKVSSFDTSWIEASTVKEIMETPVTTDITTLIFKVNAFVKKAPNTGFTNYYIDDLDGTTGSYAYTQCNGKDFAWLDEFDGKICTVYLMAINAKSSGTGCAWRFLPVKVSDDGFKFNAADAPKFAVDYYVLDQFKPSYSADPALELLTSVDLDAVGIKGVKVEYKSSNEKVVSIKNGVLHTGDAGDATVTVTASYSGKTYSTEVKINVKQAVVISDYLNVSQAAAKPVSTSEYITVKGVVGPSLVNQAGGFYLIDDTAVIAVKFDNAADIANIGIGDEIVIKGYRDCWNPTDTCAGQTCISHAVLVENYYGKNEYSTKSFDTSKTFADVFALAKDVGTDYSTQVFVIEAKIELEKGGFSSLYKLYDESNPTDYLQLYCSGAGQYSFLEQFNGKTVKFEIALCNWNKKSIYKGCILAVYTDNGKVLNTLNFNN